ncbi:MAG: tRNA pseudouridine(13) synthase TruD [Gammaproteobacteria bacterium]|nr:tRNA pseudouridine(13) synthase TruD [Gammaproteobacteria bacterium]
MNHEQLLYPYGPALASGLIKSRPEDFQVVEELGFEPSGEGEHLFLLVEKIGLSTPELIDRISRDYSIHPRLIGYSGLKDKNALTTQWLSLHLPGQEAAPAAAGSDVYRVLRAQRNRSKLRRGSHKSNFFRICIRQVDELPADSRAQLDAIASGGIANYFGAQRFGRDQDNVAQALKQLDRRGLKRARRSILLSSLRSYLFNQVLSRRIFLDYWAQPLDGDVFMLRGSHSIFSQALDTTLSERFATMDISSTASLYGKGQSQLSGEALTLEQQVFDEQDEITDCLDRQGVARQMRALRAAVEAFDYEFDEAQKTLRLELRLPAGSYMTSLLDHFIKVRAC